MSERFLIFFVIDGDVTHCPPIDDAVVILNAILFPMVGDDLIHDLAIRFSGGSLPPGNGAPMILMAIDIINVEQLTEPLPIASQTRWTSKKIGTYMSVRSD